MDNTARRETLRYASQLDVPIPTLRSVWCRKQIPPGEMSHNRVNVRAG